MENQEKLSLNHPRHSSLSVTIPLSSILKQYLLFTVFQDTHTQHLYINCSIIYYMDNE